MRAVDFFVLWFSLGVGLLVLAAGTLLVPLGLTLVEVLIVSVAGSLLGSALLVAAALPGTSRGVPTMVSLRPLLGLRGSYVPTALNVLQLLGWATFELLIMGLAGAALMGPVFGPLWTPIVLIPIFGAIVGLLAVGGPITVVRNWLERFAIWLVIGSTVWIAVQLALRPIDWGARYATVTVPSSYLLALDLVVVMPISWWPLVSDYNRFARRRRGATAGTLVGYTAANTAFYVLGAILAVVVVTGGAPDFVAAIGLLNLGFLALLFILVDETDNAFANVYSTAVSVQNAAPRWRQLTLVIATTLIAVAFAVGLQFLYPTPAVAVGSGFEGFLFLIGGLFVPLLGILAADHFAVRRGSYRAEEFSDRTRSVRPAAFLAWIPSALLYFAIVLGWLPWLQNVGATLPSFAAAAGIYLAVTWAESRVRAPVVTN